MGQPFQPAASAALRALDSDENRATSYPRMQFTVIVNPHSGPGEGELPNVNYTEALRTLNLLNNVRTIGYVATTWSKKGISMVLDEIASYAGWGVQDPSLALHGIFFDETVTKYTPDSVKYLRCISHAVRTSDGLADGFVGKNTLSFRHWAFGMLFTTFRSRWVPSIAP